MLISSVGLKQQTNYNFVQPKKINKVADNNFETKNKSTSLPVGFNTLYNISFTGWTNPNRIVGDVDLETYHIMTDRAKERYRNLYQTFSTNEEIEQKKLFDVSSKRLPLKSDAIMDKFIDMSKKYLKYKDQPIICLGRSPKWFLDTATWLDGGLDDYKFIAFSGYWYRPMPYGAVKVIPDDVPTKEEEAEYRKYIDRVGINPQQIVDTMKNEGKKTVITDYICTGKGACSFLDIMSRYADDLGILEDFANSIQIVAIGSYDYMEYLNPYADSIPTPRVPMPPLLQPYKDNIRQDFYNMNYTLFEEMLLNRNTNECRSTYYPHKAWTVYHPDEYKTGLITDMSVVKKIKEKFKDEKYITNFTAPMQDYRNLLNFRILDYLNSKNMLRPSDELPL